VNGEGDTNVDLQFAQSGIDLPEQLSGAFNCSEADELDDDDYGENRDGADFWMYRDRTVALLWRYTRLSVELGRLPSILGREFFRARVSGYDVQTFEDSVIFVHDVECCLESLDGADKVVIAMLALEQYTQDEAARYLHCTSRTIARHYGEALDRLSEVFLKREILRRLAGEETLSTQTCQETKTSGLAASDSTQ
jgi:Sigma-70, region 4